MMHRHEQEETPDEQAGYRIAYPYADEQPSISHRLTWPEYVNVTPLTLWMDTWYAAVNDQFGSLSIVKHPLYDGVGNGLFLLSAFQQFLRCFAHMVGVARLDFAYYDDTIPIVGRSSYIYPSDDGEWLQEAQAVSQARSTYLSLSVALNLLVDVRGHSGEISTVWIPEGVSIYFHTPHFSEAKYLLYKPQPPSEPGAHGVVSSEAWDRHIAQIRYADEARQWIATLRCEMASLFRSDNNMVLKSVRDGWKHYRDFAQRQLERESDEQGEQDDGIDHTHQFPPHLVTLASPPPGTPATNDELCTRNRARLMMGITTWEQVTGSQFQWHFPMTS